MIIVIIIISNEIQIILQERKCDHCGIGTLLEEGIISMGLSQKVKGVFNHKGWFQWTFNFMLRKII